MTHNDSTLINALRLMLSQTDELHGTNEITLRLTTENAKHCIISAARALEANGELTIIRSRGGRGRRTIYRRNPNSPGAPIRKRGKR